MLERRFHNLVWYIMLWRRPFELEDIERALVNLAALSDRGAIVFEVRGSRSRVQYLLGSEKGTAVKIQNALRPHGQIAFRKYEGERAAVSHAAQVKVTKPVLTLRTDCTESLIRAALAAMHQAKDEAPLVLQIVLGQAFTPSAMPKNLPNPHASWLDIAMGNVGPASPESRTSIKEKISHHGFDCTIRLGGASWAFVNALHCALRILESAGVKLSIKEEPAARLDEAHIAWHFPMRLSVKELANFLLLPVGTDEQLPGVEGLHPKLLPPPAWYAANSRIFAATPDGRKKLGISPTDAREHLIITGPTGSGKSTALLNLILADIAAGRGVLVLDPKLDLVNDVLARIPENRDKDVVVIDPSAPAPVGFNPLALKDHYNPGLAADAILAVFQAVFADNFGIRTLDVLSASLLTLVQCDGASLLWLPALLTDERFRRKITASVTDKIGLAPYWAGFEAMNDGQRRQEIAPVMNKMRQFLLRPELRSVLGQSNPKFTLTDLFDKRKIVLVPLNKGHIGPECARLLGSLLVSLTWTLALSRANLPQERRHLVSVYIDELQDYLSLPTDLSDALAQARGLGLGLTMAHQYRKQLPPDILAGVDANARNKIVFGLGADDAKAMSAMAPELEPLDFMKLPRYQVYASVQAGGRSTGWMSGRTLPPPPATRSVAELRALSMQTYGKPKTEVEAELLARLGLAPGTPPQASQPESDSGTIGRKKRK